MRLLKLKNGNGLELSYEKPGPNSDRIAVAGETHTALIHNDLYNAVQGLAVHLAIMAFHVKDVEDIAAPDAETFKNFSVGSYSVSGKDEKRGIIISGTLRKNGKAHNFNTPFYRFEEPESGRYTYMDDVAAKIRVIENEAGQYLAGDKIGEPIQGDLGLDDKKAPVHKMQIDKANPEAMKDVANMPNSKTKGGGKKKVAQSADHPGGEAVQN